MPAPVTEATLPFMLNVSNTESLTEEGVGYRHLNYCGYSFRGRL